MCSRPSERGSEGDEEGEEGGVSGGEGKRKCSQWRVTVAVGRWGYRLAGARGSHASRANAQLKVSTAHLGGRLLLVFLTPIKQLCVLIATNIYNVI